MASNQSSVDLWCARCPVQRSTRSCSPPPPPSCPAAAFHHLSPCSSSCSCGDSGLPLSLCLSFLNSNLCLQQSFVVHSSIYFLPSYWTTSTIAQCKFSQCSGSGKLLSRFITKWRLWLWPSSDSQHPLEYVLEACEGRSTSSSHLKWYQPHLQLWSLVNC